MNSRNFNLLRISGISGVITPVVAFTFISLAITYSPSFIWTDNALSDLGIQEGVTAPLFNYGLIISGILTLVFACGLFVLLSNRSMGKIGAFIFVLDALALTAIGVFPENITPTHYQVSVAFFALYPISMFVIGASFLLEKQTKMGLFTFLTAAIAVAVWITYFSTHFVSGVAIPETVSALAASAWAIVLGCKMLKEASHRS
ncbi:MAG: DUF998 domain-containing protein [Candidatus Bathyarchaeota archaeon]|nr:DUF998 domain-containing protein [Candidatus Bathyarchaeota archaeon]